MRTDPDVDLDYSYLAAGEEIDKRKTRCPDCGRGAIRLQLGPEHRLVVVYLHALDPRDLKATVCFRNQFDGERGRAKV